MSDNAHLYDELAALAVPLEKLQPHPDNYNRGDVAVIAESLRVNRMYKPVIYDKSTGYVLAGNHTLAAAKELGWGTVAAVGITPDEATARRILAVDNQSAKRSTYDEQALMDLLQAIPELTGTGFTDDDLEDLLAAHEEPIELPPAPTQAAWAETETEHEARAAQVGAQTTYGAKGLAEIVLVMTVDEKEDLMRDLDAIAKHGGGTTRAAATGRAARIALAVLDAADIGSPITDWETLLHIADTSMEDLSA